MKIEEITTESLNEVKDAELFALRHRFIQLWSKNFNGNDKRRVGTLDRKDFLHKYNMLVAEMKSRSLTMNTSSIDRALFKMRLERRKLGIDVTELEDHVIIPDFVSIAGSFVEDPSAAKDIDIVIRASERDEGLELLMRRDLKKHVDFPLHFIYSETGPHSSFIPLYSLVVRRQEDTELRVVKTDCTRDLDKGSTTSGNYEHEGRPGEVGGSAPGGGGKHRFEVLTPSEKKTISQWTENSYFHISRADSNPDNASPIEIENRDALYAAIQKIPTEECIAFRGTYMDPSKLKNLEEGNVIDVRHISSYSKDEMVAANFEDRPFDQPSNFKKVLIRADLKKGYDISHYSTISEEREVLVTKGTKLEINKIDRTEGVTYITVKEI